MKTKMWKLVRFSPVAFPAWFAIDKVAHLFGICLGG